MFVSFNLWLKAFNGNFSFLLQLHQGEGGATIQTVQSLGDVNGHENMTVDLTEATVAQDGQIYITGDDGQGK